LQQIFTKNAVKHPLNGQISGVNVLKFMMQLVT